MDLFDLLDASPPPKKKQVDDPGVGLSPDTKEATTKEENRTPEKKPRSGGKRLRGNPAEEIIRWDQIDVVKKLLKDCNLSAEFKVMGSSKFGPTVGCLACMKKRAVAESTAGQKAGEAIVDRLRTGSWAPAAIPEQCLTKFKKTLKRHLSGERHRQATGGVNEDVESEARDVPSDAQMRIVYDEVKKSPMVPPPLVAHCSDLL